MDGRARIAWNLRKARGARGISQENLAVDAGVDRSSISDIERGRFNPSIDLLDRLAGALSIDVSELLVRPPESAPPPQPLPAGRKPASR
ncbi:helix-turn-helix transcriptional regulator [Devosia sp.]|uniref:helix-turn-helix domain-containing protein n=1 Tax=Devosia sp. TaxID=1871048 RepID=UPI002AFE82E2|nr:helix-turn-helix transcriptional regulator [Devosia sp.]